MRSVGQPVPAAAGAPAPPVVKPDRSSAGADLPRDIGPMRLNVASSASRSRFTPTPSAPSRRCRLPACAEGSARRPASGGAPASGSASAPPAPASSRRGARRVISTLTRPSAATGCNPARPSNEPSAPVARIRAVTATTSPASSRSTEPNVAVIVPDWPLFCAVTVIVAAPPASGMLRSMLTPCTVTSVPAAWSMKRRLAPSICARSSVIGGSTPAPLSLTVVSGIRAETREHPVAGAVRGAFQHDLRMPRLEPAHDHRAADQRRQVHPQIDRFRHQHRPGVRSCDVGQRDAFDAGAQHRPEGRRDPARDGQRPPGRGLELPRGEVGDASRAAGTAPPPPPRPAREPPPAA